jgi:hypothetical protein
VNLVTTSPVLVKTKKDWIFTSTSMATLVMAANPILYIRLYILVVWPEHCLSFRAGGAVG